MDKILERLDQLQLKHGELVDALRRIDLVDTVMAPALPAAGRRAPRLPAGA